MKCFFHNSDLDGHCSGAIVRRMFPMMEMIGIQYGDEFDINNIQEDETVYMVDFSLQPFDMMVELNHKANLIWIDHHIEAIKEYESQNIKIESSLNTNFAACELVWKYLYPSITMPIGVYLAGRYDVWDHDVDPNVLNFQYGTRLEKTWPLNDEFWNRILNNDQNFADKIIKQGKIIFEYETITNKRIAKNMSYIINFKNHKFLVCNRSHTNSLLFDSIVNYNDVDAVMTYSRRPNCWTVSMYTAKDGINVGAIATKMGGGGHKQAAGFQIKDDNKAIEILMPKD